ncbi:MAG: DUF4199 domain-containing protein [Bacteroidota bacterium]
MQQYRIEIKWAIIFVVFSLFWVFGERLVGLHDELIAQHPTWTNLIAIPAIIIYVLALRDKRDHFYEGKMSWKQGFLAGAIMTLIVAVLSPLTQFLTATVITPDYFANAIAYSVESGNATQEEAEAFFNLNSYLVLAAVGALVMGLVTSAIVAIFVRRA